MPTEASVRFKAVSGRGDRAGGLAVRLTDADNYYVVRANALEDNVRLYRVVKGDRQAYVGIRKGPPPVEGQAGERIVSRVSDDLASSAAIAIDGGAGCRHRGFPCGG